MDGGTISRRRRNESGHRRPNPTLRPGRRGVCRSGCPASACVSETVPQYPPAEGEGDDGDPPLTTTPSEGLRPPVADQDVAGELNDGVLQSGRTAGGSKSSNLDNTGIMSGTIWCTYPSPVPGLVDGILGVTDEKDFFSRDLRLGRSTTSPGPVETDADIPVRCGVQDRCGIQVGTVLRQVPRFPGGVLSDAVCVRAKRDGPPPSTLNSRVFRIGVRPRPPVLWECRLGPPDTDCASDWEGSRSLRRTDRCPILEGGRSPSCLWCRDQRATTRNLTLSLGPRRPESTRLTSHPGGRRSWPTRLRTVSRCGKVGRGDLLGLVVLSRRCFERDTRLC